MTIDFHRNIKHHKIPNMNHRTMMKSQACEPHKHPFFNIILERQTQSY